MEQSFSSSSDEVCIIPKTKKKCSEVGESSRDPKVIADLVSFLDKNVSPGARKRIGGSRLKVDDFI